MQHKTDKALEIAKSFILDKGDEVVDLWSKLDIVAEKDDGADPTTNFDIEIESEFKKLVKKQFPGDGFVGEESGDIESKSGYTWYIDPIDGTKYFSKGVPLWGMTISLLEEGEPVLGLVYNPVSKQLYSSTKGNGAYLDGKKLEITKKNAAATQIFWDYLDLGIQIKNENPIEVNQKIYKIRTELLNDFYRVRELGSGQYSLAWMVSMSGAFVSPIRRKSKYMDISAGLLLARESGAEVIKRNLSAEHDYVIVAHPNLIEMIDKKFNFLFSNQ